MFRIIIADDHSLIREGIKSILTQDGTITVVAEASNGIDLLSVLKQQQADLIILDISMPDMNGLEAVAKIKEKFPEVKILIVTMHGNNQYFYHAISAGVHGYLMKEDSDAELLKAITIIRSGKTYVSPQLQKDISSDMISAFREQASVPAIKLSAREKEVLQLVVKGCTSKEIAVNLQLSPRTVDHHRANLLRKFNMKNTVDLVNFVIRNNVFLNEK